MTRRQFVFCATAATGVAVGSPPVARAAVTLPKNICFTGAATFEAITRQAVADRWGQQPMEIRMRQLARELEGVPYAGHTLEIDDVIESPSVNFSGLDCWTFFETVLGLARMIEVPKQSYTWTDLLAEIEWTRYRGGRCHGAYLDRIHYLDEWFFDNTARQNVIDITRRLPGAVRLKGRRSDEMSAAWQGYRYLRHTPQLVAPMRQSERRVTRLPVYFIPNAAVRAVEPLLQTSDIIGIVTRVQGVVCSHVGLAARGSDGVMRFLHASKTHGAVVLDSQLAVYLERFRQHAGIMVARPLRRDQALRDDVRYQARLKRLQAGVAPDVLETAASR